MVKERDVVEDASYGERRRHRDGRAADGRHRRLGAHARDVRERLHRHLRHEPGRPRAQDRDQLRHRGAGGLHPGGPTTRLNELQVFSASDPADRSGFQAHRDRPGATPYYGDFFPIANIGMGYNEIKAIEVRELVRAASGEAVELWPDFSVAHRIYPALLRRHHSSPTPSGAGSR